LRLNADGSIDTSFNTTGKSVVAPTTGLDSVTRAILQPDGKLLITGSAPGPAGAGDSNPVVIRMNADGTLDTTFGGTGKVFVNSGPAADGATAIGLLADGSIILAGDATNASTDIAVVKIKADGTFDTTFGTGGGMVVQHDGMDEHTIQMRIQSDGKIVIAATAGNTVEVLRVNTNGTLDTSFGTGGMVKLAPHGILDRATGLVLDGAKIVVQIGASYDTDFSETTILARLNADGSLDSSFGGTPVSSVGGTVRGDGVDGVVLDINAAVFDAELAARNDYAGSSLTLARHGGANAEDQFQYTGEVSFNGGVLTVGGVAIGHVTFGSGTITLNFESGATQGLVNRALHGIAYANTSATPPASVTIDWTFSDGNDGSQGSNGLLRTVASTDVAIGVVTDETTRAFTDPSRSPDGRVLADITYLASVDGTVRGEAIDAAQVFSAGQLALMDQYKHGAWFFTRGGGDQVTGTAYGDAFTLGKGTNFVDGGNGSDMLFLNLANAAAVDAAQVIKLEGTLSGADADAAAKGYTHKVVAGTEIDYLRNVEKITILAPVAGGPAYHRDIALVVSVNELDTSGGGQKVAFVTGTDGVDTLDASDNSALLPDTVKAKMTSTGFGVVVDGRGGNDTILGSSHGDIFINGPGNAHIDGGANTGAGGAKAQDIFQVNVASAALAAAVTVAASDDPAYTWMVTYGSGTEKDYLKNIEAISVGVTGSSTGGRFIQLAINEYPVANADLPNAYVVANVEGTDFNDHFDAAADLSAGTRAAMDQYHRGVWISTHGGDDTITGSGYYDEINAGGGVNRIDGGANAGTPPQGSSRGDTLHVTVSSAAQAAAVQVTQLAAGGSGADADAFAAGYTYKVSAAGETDYIKNIEVVNVEVADVNGNTDFHHEVRLAVGVNAYDLSQSGSSQWTQIAQVDGTAWGDVIDASATGGLLPASLQTEMAASKRGITINGGGGSDTITGSAYADNINNGAGNEHVDGGTQLSNQRGMVDVFNIQAATAAERDAVTVALSDDPAYQYKVTYGAGSSQVDYLKNVELINVWVDGGASRFIQLAMTVGEIQGTGDLTGNWAYAYANGSPLGETFNAATDVSAATLALMAKDGRGIYADMGGGNDTVIGSQWGDQVTGGAGVNYIDGGANLGTGPDGNPGADVLQLFVATSAEAAAVTMTQLVSTMTGTDKAAFDAGYTFKVVSGNEIDYVKNMERYTISIWDDKDHDGQRDYANSTDPANEVTFVASHDLVAPPVGATLVGVPVA
jgi:uncharacterized delta-60 repeat protein